MTYGVHEFAKSENHVLSGVPQAASRGDRVDYAGSQGSLLSVQNHVTLVD